MSGPIDVRGEGDITDKRGNKKNERRDAELNVNGAPQREMEVLQDGGRENRKDSGVGGIENNDTISSSMMSDSITEDVADKLEINKEDAEKELKKMRKLSKSKLKKGEEAVVGTLDFANIGNVNNVTETVGYGTSSVSVVGDALEWVAGKALENFKPVKKLVSAVAGIWYFGVHSRKKSRFDEIRKNFMENMDKNEIGELKKLKKKELLEKRSNLKEELEKLRIDKAKGIEKNDDKIKEKQKELDHLEGYIAVSNLGDINKKRVRNDLFKATSAGVVLGASALAYFNPLVGGIVVAATVIGITATATGAWWNRRKYGNAIENFTRVKRVKKKKGEKIISKADVIGEMNVREDVIRKSRLSGQDFSNEDYDILKELSGDDAYKKVSDILQNMGKEFIKIKEFEKVAEFVDTIKKSDVNNFSEGADKDRAKALVDDLEKRVEEYKGLLKDEEGKNISGYRFMRWQNDIYDAKIELVDIKDFKIDPWWKKNYGENWYSKLLNVTNGLNFLMTSQGEQVFDVVDDSKGLSRSFKNNLERVNTIVGSKDMSTELKRTQHRKYHEIGANYIIKMIKDLPERKELMRDGKEISIKDLNLDDEGDRRILHEAYETTMQYEHVKKFLNASKFGVGNREVDELIETIRNEKDPKKILKLRDRLVKEMKNLG